MRKATLSILLFAVVPVFGQLPSQTVTVQATRSFSLQPDQVVFGLSVSSSTGTNLNRSSLRYRGLASPPRISRVSKIRIFPRCNGVSPWAFPSPA